MRPLLFTLICSFLFLALAVQKTPSEKKSIAIADVVNIEIFKAVRPPDTTAGWKRLTKEQIKLFADKWNTTSGNEPKNFSTSFRIAVYLKNKTIREFRTNGRFIKENKDWCLDFKDAAFFERLYTEATIKK
ncbi:MAG: hypothetical protein IT235_07220 [Bacteroidia bacterium]|nr:hypothetical protein [Bacteroidia bacterium]